MDDRVFDNFARTLGGARSRRQVLRRLGAGLAGAVAGAVGMQRAAPAQEFCPGAVLPNITECCTVDTVAEDCTPRECRTAICDAACACCTYIEVDDREPCDGGICCNTGGSGSVCFTGGDCCVAGDCEPVACQTVGCDQDDRVCFAHNEPDGTACSGGCCETGFCDTSKKPCGEQCINQNACCTNNQSGCPAEVCQTSTCNNGSCDSQNEQDGTPCGGGICCGGECEPGGECCTAGDCSAQPCQTASCANDGTCNYQVESDGSNCAGGGVCCGGECVDLETDEHCGTCDAAPCTATQVCAACKGDCTGQDVARCCPTAKRTNCGGKCVNLKTDEANCGRCGRRCRGAKVCRRGDCV